MSDCFENSSINGILLTGFVFSFYAYAFYMLGKSNGYSEGFTKGSELTDALKDLECSKKIALLEKINGKENSSG